MKKETLSMIEQTLLHYSVNAKPLNEILRGVFEHKNWGNAIHTSTVDELYSLLKSTAAEVVKSKILCADDLKDELVDVVLSKTLSSVFRDHTFYPSCCNSFVECKDYGVEFMGSHIEYFTIGERIFLVDAVRSSVEINRKFGWVNSSPSVVVKDGMVELAFSPTYEDKDGGYDIVISDTRGDSLRLIITEGKNSSSINDFFGEAVEVIKDGKTMTPTEMISLICERSRTDDCPWDCTKTQNAVIDWFKSLGEGYGVYRLYKTGILVTKDISNIAEGVVSHKIEDQFTTLGSYLSLKWPVYFS